MVAEGVDYADGRPGGAALAAAGKTFAVRYLYPPVGKGLSPDEVADLHANGISIATVYEDTGTESLGGYEAGVTSAHMAQEQLVADGLPGNQPVYFAVDFDATASQFGVIDSYLQGAASVLGSDRVGLYGSVGLIQHVQSSGTASWFWQTYAWSGGNVASGIHLYQYSNGNTINGASVDFVSSQVGNFGQDSAVSAASPVKRKQNNMGFPVLIQNTEPGTMNFGLVVRLGDNGSYHWLTAEQRDAYVEHGVEVWTDTSGHFQYFISEQDNQRKYLSALIGSSIPAPAPHDFTESQIAALQASVVADVRAA